MSNIEEDINYVKECLKIARVFFKSIKAETDYKEIDDVAFCVAIEHILAEREQDKKRIKELEEKNKHLKYLYDDCCKCLLDTIEKQKVKDKIEELDSIQKEMTTKNHNADNINDCYRYGDEAQKAMYKKEALEEILEDK